MINISAFISNDLLPMFYDLAISLPPTLSEKVGSSSGNFCVSNKMYLNS